MFVAGNEGISVSKLSFPEEAQWAAAYRDEKQVPNTTAEPTLTTVIQRERLLCSSESYLNCFIAF